MHHEPLVRFEQFQRSRCTYVTDDGRSGNQRTRCTDLTIGHAEQHDVGIVTGCAAPEWAANVDAGAIKRRRKRLPHAATTNDIAPSSHRIGALFYGLGVP
jgi:hypothetical protein